MSDISDYYKKISILGKKNDFSTYREKGNSSPGPIYNTGKSAIFTTKTNPSVKFGKGPRIDRTK